jgi:hypothetical protein
VSPSVECLELRRLLDAAVYTPPDPFTPPEQEEEAEDDPAILNGGSTPSPNPDPPDTNRTGANLNVGLSGNEPTIAINPLNASNIAVAQYNNGLQSLKLSTDGGATFAIQRNAVLPSTGSQTFFAGDDSLAFDAQGRLFWTFLTGPGTGGGVNVVSQQVNPTTGALVGSANYVAQGDLDKEWLAADKTASSPFANNLYAVWTDFSQTNAPIRFARSTNQGATWTILSGNLSGSNEGFTWPPEVTTAPNGDVWVAWHTNTGGGGGTLGEVRMRRSTDGGLTFGSEIIPFPAGTADVTTNSTYAPRIAGVASWLQGSEQPHILVDPVRSGNLYVVEVDDPDNTYTQTGDPADIVLARSTNNGTTWTRSTISHAPVGTTQFIPSAAIDAAGNITVTWYDDRGGQKNAAGDYLLDVYATTSSDGGLSFANEMKINDLSFDPDLGAPDRFAPTKVYRVGEYSGVVSVGGTASAVWTGNTSIGQQIVFGQFSTGFQAIGSTPASGQLISTPATDFVIPLSNPVTAASVQATDLTVNGIAASSFGLNAAGDTITFHYNVSPVTTEGVQTIAIAAGAFTRQSDAAAVVASSITFRYDPQPLAVVATTPADSTLVTLPVTTLTVNFNEPITPGSADTGDLTLSQGTVTAAAVQPGNQAVKYTLSGLTAEAALGITMAAGALTDVNGNPSLAYSGTLQLDITTAAATVPLLADPLLGSLIYGRPTTGDINLNGDTDSFTVALDAGQDVTIRVDPTTPGPATLAPSVQLLGPLGTSIGVATAAAGKRAVLQTAAAATAGTYTVVVGGAGGTVGNYTVEVLVNAALEAESNDGPSNNTPATAQDLNPAFLTVNTTAASADRAGVVGVSGDADVYSFSLAAGQSTSLALGGSGAGATVGQLGDRTDYSGLDGPTSVAYGDFNRDGKLDMVATNSGGSGLDTTVGVRLGNGDGTFGPLTLYGTGGSNPRYVAVDDINGDGFLDIVTTNQNSNTVGLLLGDGNGGFGTASTYSTGAGSSPFGITTADMNKDGKADVIVADFGTNNVSVFLGQANGTLLPAATVAVGTSPTIVAAGDLNKDGKIDVVTSNLNSGNITVLLGNGSGGFTSATSLTAQSGPFGVALGDFNGDSKLDAVVANQTSDTLSIFLGNGDGTFAAAANIAAGGSSPRSVAVADMNHDGKLDIATVNIDDATASVLLGNGDGTFATPVVYATSVDPNTVALPDVNNDGLPDLSTADFSGNSVSLRLNDLNSLQLQLIAPDGTTVLRTGAAAANLAASINGFVAPAAGTYYARVGGYGTTSYDLVVTRGAAFDTEGNNSFAAAQPIDGTQGAFGYVVGRSPVLDSFETGATDVANYTFTGSGTATVTAAAAHDGAFGLQVSNFNSTSAWIYRNDATAHVQQGDTIDYWVQALQSGSSTGRAYLGFGASSAGAISIVMATNSNTMIIQDNVGFGFSDVATVNQAWVLNHWYLVKVNWGVGGLITARLYDSDGSTLLNTVSGTDNAITSGGIAFRAFGLTHNIDTVVRDQAQDEDWYSISLAGGSRALRVETSTPADGANQFTNTLNPRIELYDPSGTLVANGVANADGRNETIQYVAAPGTYRIRVVGESSTVGEYFLGVTAPGIPTITWPQPADITYGTVLGSTQLVATAAFAGQPVPGTFAYTPATGAALNAGTNQALSATFTPSDTSGFTTATGSSTINVIPASLKVTVKDASKLYGDPDPAFGVSYQGFVLGQDQSVLGGNPSFGTAAGVLSVVGDYTVSASGLTSANYAITYAAGTLHVNPAPLAETV